jgi:hypothetical protein
MDAPSQRYPQALPHKPPPEMALQADLLHRAREELAVTSERLRRMTCGFVIAVLGALILGAAVVVLAMGWTGPAVPPPLGESADLTKKSPVSVAPPAIQQSSPATAPPERAEVKPVQGAAPLAVSKPVADALATGQKEAFLEALGGLAGAHLHESYLTIVLLADSVEGKIVSKEDAKNTLKSVTDWISAVESGLAKLDAASLDADDQAALERNRTVTAMLRLQSQRLLAYWTSGEMEKANQYQQARKATRAALSKVLGLEVK